MSDSLQPGTRIRIDTLKAGTYDQGKWVIPF